MLRRIVPLLLLLGPAPALACDVTLSNASNVDVGVSVNGRHIVLSPGQTQRLPITALAIIEFGAIGHEFRVDAAQDALCGLGKPKSLEARQDGALWLQGKIQPNGLPLLPISRQDLTAAPPNNAFKPNSFRYANNMAGKACHVLGSATRVGLT